MQDSYRRDEAVSRLWRWIGCTVFLPVTTPIKSRVSVKAGSVCVEAFPWKAGTFAKSSAT
jgi:hypothetical protein